MCLARLTAQVAASRFPLLYCTKSNTGHVMVVNACASLGFPWLDQYKKPHNDLYHPLLTPLYMAKEGNTYYMYTSQLLQPIQSIFVKSMPQICCTVVQAYLLSLLMFCGVLLWQAKGMASSQSKPGGYCTTKLISWFRIAGIWRCPKCPPPPYH